MLRSVPRALLVAAVAGSAAACAAGTGGAGSADFGGEGGRYGVLIPTLEVQGGVPAGTGESVAERLRGLISNMATHTAVSERFMRGAMDQHEVAQLDSITSRQLAQQINAQLASWGTIEAAGEGLQADVRFTDVRSGDQIVLEDVTAANADALSQAIFQGFETQIEGLRQAVFCNDYLSSQQYEQALENCDQALALAPQSTTALYGKATALYNLERYEESLATYEQALEIDPTHDDALLGAGLAAGRLGQSEQATAFLTQHLEQNPGDLTVRMSIAGDIAQAGDYIAAAEVLLPAATPENADNLDFQQYLAQVTTAAGQAAAEAGDEAAASRYFETALSGYEAVFAARPDSLEANVLRQAVAVYLELDRTDDALRIAEMATQQFGDDAGVWSTYASVLSDMERHAEAAQALDRALQIDPELENGYVRLGLAQIEAGDRQAGLQSLETAASRGNRQSVAQVFLSMGAAELQAEDFADAQPLLELANRYAAEGQQKSDISFYLGYALVKQGEAIAKANTQGSASDARRALDFFRRSVPLLQASNHQSAAGVLAGARQYIANQEAIIEVSGGR